MKKFLAITLSLLMVFSCMTCLFTSPVSAAETTDTNWQTPATDSWVSISADSGTPAVNGPLVKVSAASRAIYTRVTLDPNTKYEYTMYTKNIVYTGYNQFTIVSSLGSDALDFAKLSTAWTDYKVTNADPNHVAEGAVVAHNSYFKDLGATDVTGADGATWQKITVSFTTSTATEYLIIMNSLPPVDKDQPIYLSDVKFEKKLLGAWKSGRSPQIVTTESNGSAVVPYNNGPAYRIYTWPCNQSIYTTATLEPNTTYNFTAYFKGYYIPAVGYGGYGGVGTATDGKGDTWVVSTNAGFDDCRASDGSVSTDGTWLAFDDNDGYENLYKKDAYRDAYTNLNTWRKYSFNFTTTADTEYYIVLGIEQTTSENGNVDFYMSDVAIKKVIGMSATAEGEGSVKVSNAAPDVGEEVTFTATPYAGALFLGWYNGDVKVSDDPVYTVTADNPLSLTAKFEGEVIDWKSPASWVSFATVSGTPAANGPLVQVKSSAYQAVYARVNLKANTNYNYTMYVKNLTLSSSYNQFSIVSSLGSDELDFAKLSANWADYKVTNEDPNHVADGAVVAFNSYFKDLGATEVIGADGATWSKINVSFTTSDATQYIIVMNSYLPINSSDNVYISDAVFMENISMSAIADGNGTVTVSNSAPINGEQVTFTATPRTGAEFLGWYNGDVKVSDNLVYTVTATESLALTAKFEGGATAVDGWVCPRDTNGWITTTTDIAPKAGGTVYKTGSWPCDRSIYTKVTLKPGTTYTFSAYFMGAVAAAIRNNADPNQPTLYQNGKGDETWIISANADITKGNYLNGSTVTATKDWNEFTGNGNYVNLNKGDGYRDNWSADNQFTTWRKYEVTFTTGEDTEYYIILGLEGDSSKQTGQASGYPTYMSDPSIIEVGDVAPEVTDFTTNIGASLRKESESAYGQAIRHKFTLDKNVFTTNYDGFKLVEFGFVTATTSALEGHANVPVLNATSYKVLTGVAYKADYNGNVSKNIVFDEDDTNVIYTAALYNISDYAKSYTVAPYAIFEDAYGTQVVRYGEAQSAAIFDVAKAILAGNNASDKEYVNNTLLAGDYKAQYDAWLDE